MSQPVGRPRGQRVSDDVVSWRRGAAKSVRDLWYGGGLRPPSDAGGGSRELLGESDERRRWRVAAGGDGETVILVQGR